MEQTQPFIATTGVTTFLSTGTQHLAGAARAGARFVLIILEDSEDRSAGTLLPAMVKSYGVQFVREINPCDRVTFRAAMADAVAFTRSADGGIAIIIAARPCLQLDPATDLPVADVQTSAASGDCAQCLEGFEVEPDPTSIFELAQQVARDRYIQHV